MAITRDQMVFVTDVISRILSGESVNCAECAACYGLFGLKQLADGLNALRQEYNIPNQNGEVPKD